MLFKCSGKYIEIYFSFKITFFFFFFGQFFPSTVESGFLFHFLFLGVNTLYISVKPHVSALMFKEGSCHVLKGERCGVHAVRCERLPSTMHLLLRKDLFL